MIDGLGHFFVLAFSIALVAATLRHDRPATIVREAAKFFVFVCLGVFAFAVFVHVLPSPEAVFAP